MKNTLLSIIAIILIALPTFSSAQQCKWIKTINDYGRNYAHYYYHDPRIIADHHHNIIITGQYSQRVYFGSTTFIKSGGMFGQYVAKYDSAGNILWAKELINVSITGIAVDKDDNIYVTGGSSADTSYLSPTDTLYNNICYKGFLMKYDASGNVKWVRATNGIAHNVYAKRQGVPVTGLTVDKNNDIAICGNYHDTVSLSGTQLVGKGFFIAKYAPDGSLYWAKSGSTNSIIIITALTSDNDNNICIAGTTNGLYKIWMGTDTIAVVPPASGDGYFVAKFDSVGKIKWVKAENEGFSSTGFESASIATDSKGNVYSCGNAYLTTLGNPYGYITKYTPNGIVEWKKIIDGKGPDISGVAVDKQDFPYVIGTADSVIGLGTSLTVDTLTLFVARLDTATGNSVWVKTPDMTYPSEGIDIYVDDNGTIDIAGFYDESLTIDSVNVLSVMGGRPFIAQIAYKPAGVPNVIGQYLDFNIFPNPSTGIMNIAFDAGGYHSIHVTDLLGQTLLAKETAGNKVQLNIAKLAPGNYFITVTDANGGYQTKEIVKR